MDCYSNWLLDFLLVVVELCVTTDLHLSFPRERGREGREAERGRGRMGGGTEGFVYKYMYPHMHSPPPPPPDQICNYEHKYSHWNIPNQTLEHVHRRVS